MTLVVGIPACAEDLRNGGISPPTRGSRVSCSTRSARCRSAIPPVGEAQIGLLERIDGLLIPGSPSNVHPSHYGIGESLTPDRHDPLRDATTLPLIPRRRCTRKGCR